VQVYAIAGDVICRPLDAEVAVFLSDRCQTHLLDDAGGQVLQALQKLSAEAAVADIDHLAAHLLDESLPARQVAAQAVVPAPAPSTDSNADTGAWQRHQEACDALRPVLAALVHIGVLTVSPC
jgi:hypothetical protein